MSYMLMNGILRMYNFLRLLLSSTNISCLLRKKSSLEESLDARHGRLGGGTNFWVCVSEAICIDRQWIKQSK